MAVFGVDSSIENQHTEAEWDRLLSSRSPGRGRYRRANGDIAPDLPLARHMYWAGVRRFVLVEVLDDAGLFAAERAKRRDEAVDQLMRDGDSRPFGTRGK